MKLNINWKDFLKETKRLSLEAQKILDKEREIDNNDDLEKIQEEIKKWTIVCNYFFIDSFDSETNEFANSFYYRAPSKVDIAQRQKNFFQYKKETFQVLKEKRQALEYYEKLLSVSDAIIKPDSVDIEVRHQYNTEETLDLILEKLYDLYDDGRYSINAILKGSGIELKRYGEERELAEVLVDNDFIEVIYYTNDVVARLTTHGKIYIEDKRKIKSTDYSHINDSEHEIKQKIDEVIFELKKLGIGQEFLFEELEELKELYKTLNKKNWGQILKGKIIDLGLSQIINYDTMKFIYKELTNEILKLK